MLCGLVFSVSFRPGEVLRRYSIVFENHALQMLGLVDYVGSDDEETDDSQNEECIHAEVVLNPVKRLKSEDKEDRTRDVCYSQDDGIVGQYDGISNAEEVSSILNNLPPSIHVADKHVQEEKELDDLVKRKDWELKLARKAERKRKHHLKHLRNSNPKYHHSSNTKKIVVIPAFSGLKGLINDGEQEKSDEQPGHLMVASSSTNLLSFLPEPKNASKISRNVNVFLSSNVHSTGNAKMPQVVTTKEISKETKFAEEENDDTSDEDQDSTDFFGLKATDDSSVVSNTIPALDILRDKKLEKMKLKDDVKIEDNVSAFVSHPETTVESYDTTASTSLSGAIDNNQALCMIYSRDVAHLGGTVSNAAKAVENMVDVNVDKVLGPNVHATLLKNLHNKSLAEATLSHLANMPKSKESISMVARRKHQITYLASVAVAREEQLAEQWSVNRHNKRTSARKYGF
ncbi:Proline-rich protein PRCC [Dirofilaria immitis]